MFRFDLHLWCHSEWLLDIIYMQAHPEAQFYRSKALMNFNDLCLIYAHTTADGRYSLSSRDIDFDDDIQGVNTGVFLYPVMDQQK